MRKFLLSTAAIALLATPALAQEHRGRGGERGDQSQQAAQPAPAAPAPAAPAAAPAPAPEGRGLRTRQAPPAFMQQPQAAATPSAADTAQVQRDLQANDRRNDSNRRDNNDRRQDFRDRNNDGRADFRDRNNDGRPDFRRPGGSNFQGNRTDWSRYHRNFTAQRRFHAPNYRRPSGWYSHRWVFGDMLPSIFWSSNYWLDGWDNYGLMSPPPGTVWVRYGDDALLIDRYSGEVIQVEYGIFY